MVNAGERVKPADMAARSREDRRVGGHPTARLQLEPLAGEAEVLGQHAGIHIDQVDAAERQNELIPVTSSSLEIGTVP